jgi:hypothetical protein
MFVARDQIVSNSQLLSLQRCHHPTAYKPAQLLDESAASDSPYEGTRAPILTVWHASKSRCVFVAPALLARQLDLIIGMWCGVAEGDQAECPEAEGSTERDCGEGKARQVQGHVPAAARLARCQ